MSFAFNSISDSFLVLVGGSSAVMWILRFFALHVPKVFVVVTSTSTVPFDGR